MAFKFSRSGASTNHNQSNCDGPNDKNISATNKNTNNTNIQCKSSGFYPAWLKDSSALRKAYYGSLGQVQLQPALDGNKLPSGLDKLVINRRQEFSLDNFTDSSRVQQLLSTSRLPNGSLAAIWACCNKTRPGVLTNRELCLALGLIAIFQRVQDQQLEGDPFSLLKLEKSPPVPKLYETARETVKTRIASSCPVPNDLLIDISNGSIETSVPTYSKPDSRTGQQSSPVSVSLSNNAISLIDSDGDKSDSTLMSLTNIWMRFMTSMQVLYKRSFDVLNVETSRSSALEALTTPAGVSFSKGLSLCYPIAHNIKFKIDELKNALAKHNQSNLLSDKYLTQINNIMVSINEYWAVLINLFHGSGQTDFIELIMDGLIHTSNKTSVSNQTLDELIGEHPVDNKCAICLTEFYLVNMGDALERSSRLPQDDIDTLYDTKLITMDDKYYYHPKCANFWLNNVPGTDGRLPYDTRRETDDAILKPTK